MQAGAVAAEKVLRCKQRENNNKEAVTSREVTASFFM